MAPRGCPGTSILGLGDHLQSYIGHLLRPRLSYGIVDAIPARNFPASMRRVFTSRRLLMKASSVAVLWLLFVSTGYAGPTPRRAAVGRVCNAQAATLRKLLRPPKSVGGPVRAPSTRTLAGLADSHLVLKRPCHADVDDDRQAIQNDAPAARLDFDDLSAPTLRELGVLPNPFSQHVHSRAFTPRSPRGPPFFG